MPSYVTNIDISPKVPNKRMLISTGNGYVSVFEKRVKTKSDFLFEDENVEFNLIDRYDMMENPHDESD